MKLLLLLLLMNSAFSLSFVSGSILEPIYDDIKDIRQSWNDLISFIKCTAFDFVHLFFQNEDRNVNYLHFSPKNPKESCDLQPTAEGLKRCQFDPKLETKVLIHGWITKFPVGNTLFFMKDMFLQSGDYNVVIYNWTAYNQNKTVSFVDYPASAFITFLIGIKLSSWIGFIQDNTGVDPKSFHLLGHSLGSEVSAIAGKTTCTLGRITFLDPAAPLFRNLPPFLKPAPSDALETEAIHTDAAANVIEGYGYIQPVAQIDFYPNGGNNQPKCYNGSHYFDMSGERTATSKSDINCNHNAAVDYITSSINKSCHFIGLICDDYESFLQGKCNKSNSVTCQMGIYEEMQPNLPIHSKCYFQTSAHPPYCLN